MRDVGNAVAAAAFAAFDLPPKPSRDASSAEKMAYSQAKYGRGAPDFVAAAARLQAKAARLQANYSSAADKPTPSSTTPRMPEAQTVTKTPVPKPTSIVTGARRQPPPPAPPPPSNVIDLIDFGDAPPVAPHPVPAAATGQDVGIMELMKATATDNPHENEIATHQKKKANVLAHFGTRMSVPIPAVPVAMPASMPVALPTANYDSNAFFAQFGL